MKFYNLSTLLSVLDACEHMSALRATGNNSCPQVDQSIALLVFSNSKEHRPMWNTMFPTNAKATGFSIFVTTLTGRMFYSCGNAGKKHHHKHNLLTSK